MKKILSLVVLAAAPFIAMAQTTNIYPATGSVGLGILSPDSRFKINIHTSNVTEDNMIRMVHDGISPSNFQFGTASSTYGVPAHRLSNVIESFRDLRISAANPGSNIIFETGRESTATFVRMKIAGDGKVGIGTEAPAALLHINTSTGTFNNYLRVSQSDYSNGFMSIVNGAGASFLPTIIGRADAASRTLGIGIVGETNDIPTPANEPHTAAVMIQARSNQVATPTLTQANLLSVINHTTSLLMVKANGNVGIGTINPGTNKLAVEGTIAARKVKVTQATPWPDFVFKPEYQLPTLDEVAAHIKEKGHLPGIPAAAEVEKNGQDLGDMNAKLLQKVEELTLYLLDMKFNNERLQRENDAIRKRLANLEAQK